MDKANRMIIAPGGIKAELSARIERAYPEFGVVDLGGERDRLSTEGATAEICYGSLRPGELQHLPNLRWIQALSAGVFHMLEPPLIESNIVLTNASGIHAAPMAEQFFAMLLALTRRLAAVVRSQGRAKWREVEFGSLDILEGKVLLVVGAGAIGRRVSSVGRAFGMRTIGIRRSGKPCPEYDEVRGPDALDRSLAEADVVVNLLPRTAETDGMFDADRFARMKSTVLFFNLGRGSTVVEADLIVALKERRMAGAGLDVYEEEPLPSESPLWNLEQVIVSPHLGGSRPDYQDRAFEIFEKNLGRYVAGEPMINLVDKRRGY